MKIIDRETGATLGYVLTTLRLTTEEALELAGYKYVIRDDQPNLCGYYPDGITEFDDPVYPKDCLLDMYDMDADMMTNMVRDWLADNSPEMDNLVLDGEPYYSSDFLTWSQDAHDSKTSYTLTAYNGYIKIV